MAAEWCGWENSFQCEINDFCQKVLAKNFPHADRHTDIKAFDARRYRGTVDVLSGGFPCQPASIAGKRKGAEDDRWLWPEMLRIVDEVRPRWIVGENVAGLASLGLDSVLFDMEASGYTCQTVLLPACSVGAPHRRDRLWIIAHARSGESERWRGPGFLAGPPRAGEAGQEQRQRLWDAAGHSGPAAKPGDFRLTEPPLRGADDGLPAGLVRVSTRARQLKAYGNSIVPQVALEIFQAINQVEA